MSGWNFIRSHIFGQKEDSGDHFIGGGGSRISRPISDTLEKAASALGVTQRVVSLGKAGLEEDPNIGNGLMQGEREMRLVKQNWMQEQMKKR